MKALIIMLAFTTVCIAIPGPARAYETFSEETGHECGYCHNDPLGGGGLTEAGGEFAINEGVFTSPVGGSVTKKLVRLIVGYLHILAGVVWFGTIFYVHILLRPAYASKGLPRGELILGWTCIIVVGVTGVLLSYARVGTWDALTASKFGILLIIKSGCYLTMALTAAAATFIIGPRLKARASAPPSEPKDGVYGPDTLLSFDGRDGRRTLAAVDGKVYDLSASRLWKGGKHMRHLAGMDLSEAIKQAPHGPEKLEAFLQAGTYDPDASHPAANRPKAAFYVMAYLNLGLVFVVLGIVALWRWW